MGTKESFEPKARVAQRYHNRRAAALYLGLSPRTLEKWRLTGQGPLYTKRGRRCVYRLEYLDVWAEAGMRRSTSQNRATSA